MTNRLKMKNLKVIIWDCDNTIWIHRKDEQKIIAEEFGIPETEELTKQYFSMFENFDKSFRHEKVTYAKIVKLVEKSMPILQEHSITPKEFLDKWMPLETSFLNEEALETIKCLKERGYQNIILTDWLYLSQIKLLRKYGIMPYIDCVYTCDDQYLKKNPKSVSRVIKKGYEKDYVIIGDSLKSDIAFGNYAGIRSIWFNPNREKNITRFIPTTEVVSLLEVCDIVD